MTRCPTRAATRAIRGARVAGVTREARVVGGAIRGRIRGAHAVGAIRGRIHGVLAVGAIRGRIRGAHAAVPIPALTHEARAAALTPARRPVGAAARQPAPSRLTHAT